MAFAIKAAIIDPLAEAFTFIAQKTMYGGKQIGPGDTTFIFSSETDGGQGLIARGVVTVAEAIERAPDVERQTHRVTLAVTCTDRAKRPLGRDTLKLFRDWDDGRPESELNFKFYRQSTNKIVAISNDTTAFLNAFF